MRRFEEFSLSPGVRVDPDTGEVLETLEDSRTLGTACPGSYSSSRYSQESIDTARSVTSELCEKILRNITAGKIVQRGNNRGHDIVLQSGEKIEAKVGRIGNSAIIKQNQLFDFDANFWGFVFYRTLNNLPPSFFTSQKMRISPKEALLRKINVESVFIFPTEVMRYYWNTANVKRGIISTTGISHRPFAISRAEGLINDVNIPGERHFNKGKYGRHKFLVKTIGFNI